jgi:hypothetical protein
MNRDKRDLGVTLIAATLLLLTMTYFAQCTTTTRSLPPTAVEADAPERASEYKREESEHKRKSVAEAAEEEDREESQRVKNVAHALQTIGANPELRRTYGFPP